MIFNKNNNGGEELRNALGFLDASTNFNKWEPYIKLATRQLTGIIGTELYRYAENYYLAPPPPEPAEPAEPEPEPAEPNNTPSPEVLTELVRKIQLANALFAYVRFLPSLDAGHSNTGRKKELAENEKSLTAAEAYKDENGMLMLAYEATDDIIQYAIEHAIPAFVGSDKYKMSLALLLPSHEAFNQYFALNSVRMYFTIVPIVREMQRSHLLSAYTAPLLADTLTAVRTDKPNAAQVKLIDIAHNIAMPALALHSMATAAERLPVEVFPSGVLTSQVISTGHERRNADKESIALFVANCRKQADKYCHELQTEVQRLLNPTTEVYVAQPKAVGKGFRF